MAAMVAASLRAAPDARADEIAPPDSSGAGSGGTSAARVRWAPVAGALTALLPLAAGSVLLAQDDRPELQRRGMDVVLIGLAAAPWVAEGMTGRWSRAAAFGVTTLLTSAGAMTARAIKDPFIPGSTKEGLPTVLLLTATLFAAAASVIDSFLAEPRGAEPR
jgi:hypothetical protein